MSLMKRLRAARPAHLNTPTDPDTRSRELDYAFSQPRKAAPRRRFRPVLGLGIAGVVAAAAVVPVVLLDKGGAEPVTAPTASVYLDARTVLLSAATQAESQPEKVGDWWRSEVVQRLLSPVQGGAAYNVYENDKATDWTPYATGGERVNRSQPLGFTFPTPEDEAAWKQAGSPAKVLVGAPKPVNANGSKTASYEIDAEPGKERVERSGLLDGDKVFWLGKNVTMKELRELPSDPKRLKAWLLNSYGGHDTESSSVPMTSDAWLYRVATGLIADMPVTPKVRAAAFRMLADLETVQVKENVKDLDGREGAAVAMQVRANGAVLLDRLLFDRSTGRALQTDSVVVVPGGYQKAMPEGTVWNAVTIVSSGWSEETP